MSKGLVVLGDKTTHGGEVITASSKITVNGKTVALVGDLISCPLDGHGTNPIVEGLPQISDECPPVVVDGCQCQCGCRVIASAANGGRR